MIEMVTRIHVASGRPDGGLDDVVDQLLGTLLWLAATLGALAVVGALIRWAIHGWQPRLAVHMFVYVLILGALVAGRRLSRRVRSILVVGAIGVNGVASVYFDGGLGNSTLMLTVGCILAGVFLGRRAAVVGVIVSLGAIVLVAAGRITGAVPSPAAPELRFAGDWFGHTMTFAVFTAAALFSVDGVLRALRGSLTRLAQRTAELREREEHYRLLAENSLDVVFKQDMALNITYASASAQNLFGYSADELPGITMSRVLTSESYQHAMETFREYAARAERDDVVVPLMQFEYLRKDGSRFWGELRVSFLRDAQGRLCGSQGILRDITDRKRAEDERERMQAHVRETERLNALGQLAGGVAHDFNNQLGGIMGFADLLKLTQDPAEARQFAENILVSARRAADLTAKLLAFARRGRIREELVDVHGLIREVTSVLERSIDKNVDIRSELAASEATVLGDPTLLQNALLNVALNARDAMPSGGEFSFSTSVESGFAGMPGASWLVVRAADTGSGMDAETQKRVFEPFFTTKEPGRGTGMGLAAVHGTVRSHGGAIEVESLPGHGTTFTIRLPLALGQRAAPAPLAAATIRGSGHVLVVDDEPMVRAMTHDALAALGYRVTGCACAGEAIQIFQQSWRDIDLVVLDLMLPDLPGRRLFDALRAVHESARILLVSGHSAEGEAGYLMQRGAAGFLQKPFSVSALSTEVARILEDPAKHQAS
jgi:two-component system cell cycle sensor histidine kinase/response regulator CckA